MNPWLYLASTWVLPALLAITLHEAAHGYAAKALGDPTAARAGRLSLNPLRHVDPFGTVVLPALLLFGGAPFLFGYAKPVPVDMRRLGRPRRDMALVAAAGPAMNLALAVAAALVFGRVSGAEAGAATWVADNMRNAIILNLTLAAFNMIPLPPLDGGRVAVGVLPPRWARPLARLEPKGMLILIGLIVLLPLIGMQVGRDLNVLAWVLVPMIDALIVAVDWLTFGSLR